MTWQQALVYLQNMVHTTPERFGYHRTRWTLQMILESCWEWLAVTTLTGCWKVLRRMRIRWRRGQGHVHSPDPRYLEKRQRILNLYNHCSTSKTAHFLYLDEVGYERQPTLASAYHPMDEGQPRAELTQAGDAVWRFIGAVDAHTGRVFTLDRKRTTVASFHTFYKELCAEYPAGDTLYIAMDNWPVHYHPDLVRHLGPQPYAADFHYPLSWSDMLADPLQTAPSGENLPIVIVPLPTYAPWLNPIEKLWGKSRREVTHMHQNANDFNTLKQRLRNFFATFRNGSTELLHAIGLYQI